LSFKYRIGRVALLRLDISSVVTSIRGRLLRLPMTLPADPANRISFE
jgi:hypothetical protein